MDHIDYLPIGARTTGKIVKINAEKSAKMGLYSTILQIGVEYNTELGKIFAKRGFWGIMLTEKRADSMGLKVGDLVSCQIITYRTRDFNGQTNIAAQCEFIGLVEAISSIEAAKPSKVSEDTDEALDRRKRMERMKNYGDSEASSNRILHIIIVIWCIILFLIFVAKNCRGTISDLRRLYEVKI